jgi:hypothetical protein
LKFFNRIFVYILRTLITPSPNTHKMSSSNIGLEERKEKSLFTKTAKRWFWSLEELNKSSTTFTPISEKDEGDWDDLFTLCNMMANGDISLREFYATAVDLDMFDMDLLGPEFADLDERDSVSERINLERNEREFEQ